ncbi:enoyl-CoA hydratase [Halomonas ventosae]|uniref:Enoyl-CoA hydratase domain-containing protein 3, mitochondrial n=1 Tax=Halomonas ventosae TaxID=229007 RepID=A0A2T0VLI5_9GAMM|nr:enoyl-CoA hydratase [Halomonas ventosae]PRY71130.1 enoyl-CoA hydratase/carnithine racemase [Halomonas ventosae]
MQDDSPLVRRHERDGVTTLTLNRPAQFNALSEEMLEALGGELDRVADDVHVRCVVIAAEGRAFCAGHDLKQMRATPDEAYYLPVPVVARVQGIATAAGCQLVASCDLAVAARSARFAVSGINAGLFCSTPAVALSRNVARKRAMEMLFTGEFIDADQARDWGLVNRVTDDAALDDMLDALTASICAKSAVAVRTGKAMFHRQLAMPLDEAYAFAGEVMARNMMAEDAGEGIDAFIEKRPPQWRHR